MQNVQGCEALGHQHPDPEGRVYLVQAISRQGGHHRPAQDKTPQQRRNGVVADEIDPLGELALEDSHTHMQDGQLIWVGKILAVEEDDVGFFKSQSGCLSSI